MPDAPDKKRTFAPVALLLAWLIPGAGHVYLGRTKRGLIIFFTVGAMFWTGMAMGGATTVDRTYERWWFIADLLTGMHGLAGWRMGERVHQNFVASLRDDERYREHLDRVGSRIRGARVEAVLNELRQPYYADYLADAERHGGHPLGLGSSSATIARAYAGVAGLMNLLCIFDAVLLSVLGVFGEPKMAKASAAEPDARSSSSDNPAADEPPTNSSEEGRS